MILRKNNELKKTNNQLLCEIHNDKKSKNNRVKLSMSKSHNCVKTYHPLKNKKIKLHRLKFVSTDYDCDFTDAMYLSAVEKIDILSRRYCANVTNKETIWATETMVINWLLSCGVEVKRISDRNYVVKNRVCSLNHVLVFANKKRIELGLEPFFMDGLTEC